MTATDGVTEQRYFARDEDPGTELDRLNELESLFDPATTTRLADFGVTDGWHCLVIGGGGGSIVRWLADRVTRSGRVVATDVDTQYLTGINAPNLEIVRHDIINDDLDLGSFDLVHCRHLLIHLVGRQEDVLAKMTGALRPGGYLFAEESDIDSIRAVDAAHPLSAAFDRTTAAVLDAARAESIFERAIVPTLPVIAKRIGLEDVRCQGRTSIEFGGDALARFYLRSGALMSPMLVGKGYISEEDAAARDAAYADPTFCFQQATTYQLIGRRASAGSPTEP